MNPDYATVKPDFGTIAQISKRINATRREEKRAQGRTTTVRENEDVSPPAHGIGDALGEGHNTRTYGPTPTNIPLPPSSPGTQEPSAFRNAALGR